MLITRQIIAEKLAAHLRHQIDLGHLVNWAEQQILDGEFDSVESRDAVARLGVADVRAFGLTWEECEQILSRLGFRALIDVVAV